MKNALITGATANTGLCTAKKLAQLGYRVHITGRNLEKTQRAADSIMKAIPGSEVLAYSSDISKCDDIENLFHRLRESTDTLDIFVANAANLGIGFDTLNTTFRDFDEIVNTNIRGTFFCAAKSAELMKAKGGSIVLMSSVQSKGAVKGRSVYGITKAAINYMAKALAYDLAPYSIRVNTLLAGAIRTDRWDKFDENALSDMRSRYPAHRESTMDEIADAIIYLAQDCPKTLTGTELLIDSGVSISLLSYNSQ